MAAENRGTRKAKNGKATILRLFDSMLNVCHVMGRDPQTPLKKYRAIRAQVYWLFVYTPKYSIFYK